MANAKIATLQDNFPGTALNTTNWYLEPISDGGGPGNGNPSGTVTVASNTLSLSNGVDNVADYYTSVNSNAAYDLTSSAAFLRLLPYTTTSDPDTGWGVGDSGLDNGYSFGVSLGKLYVESWNGGGNSANLISTNPSYNATSDAWLKISCTTTTLSFWASADGINWGTALYTAPTTLPGTGWTLASAYIQMFYGSSSGDASPPGAGSFQSFNITPGGTTTESGLLMMGIV